MSPQSADSSSRRRHFSLLRTFVIADVFTLANASCGTIAIFMSLNYLDLAEDFYLWTAFALLPLALAFDMLDGYVARRRDEHSVLGVELDSLADTISFGVAPAVMGYTLGLRGGWDVICLVYFVVCGLSRLARYNVTLPQLADERGKVHYYEGLPIPTSIILVAVLAFAFATGRVATRLWLGELSALHMSWHPLALLYFLAGSGMISRTLHIPKP